MATFEELKEVRVQKLNKLKAKGINPYPARVPRTHSLAQVKDNFASLQSSKQEVSVTGRVMAIRGQGSILFVVLNDGTTKFQAVFKKDAIGSEDQFDLFFDVADIGDFISVTGTVFATEKGEQSVLVNTWIMATKALLPLPDKWAGFKDEEERFRKRYLDILMNKEVRDVFDLRLKFWDATRDFLKKEGFFEVETPTLELTTGGAEARPFRTHHNDFDLSVFLRISVGELWQKRLLAAGFPRVFEIGRVYRNEGSSPEHLQEFTNFEFYAAYMDYKEGMQLTERMLKSVAQETFGTLEFEIKGNKVSLDGEWGVIEYVPYVEEKTGINVLESTEAQMKAKLDELGVSYEGENRERLTDTLWKWCRKQIPGPVWLIHHPKLVSPLSKSVDTDPRITERCQLILGGSEVFNGFSELNDPIDQRHRFEVQQALIERGDDEAMMPEWEFVEMLEHGMPPAFGFAYGDRLFSMLVGKPIRETVLFPLMKPKEEGTKKDKEQKIAVVVLNKQSDLLPWQKMNTVAHLSASFAGRTDKKLFFADKVKTADDQAITLNIQHAIIIKECQTVAELKTLVEEAKKHKLEIAEFTREMLETTNDKKVAENTKKKDFKDVEFLGVLVFGSKTPVTEVTKNTSLLS